MRLLAGLAVATLVLGACGGAATPAATSAVPTASPSPSPSPTPETKFTFLADLKTTNEVPAIANAEASCSGKGTFTLNTTKDATGKITAATAGFDLAVTGCPANTPLTLFHIHKAAAGAIGSVVVGGKTDAANPITLATGATTTPITVASVTVDPQLATDVIAGPAGFYFNVHSQTNPGGLMRGQLSKG